MKKFILILLFAIFLAGCGYKPAAHQARKALKDRIYIDAKMNLKDLENSVIVKDALNDAIISRFGSSVSSEDMADTVISVALKDVTFKPLLVDSMGYSTVYRAIVELDFEVKRKTDENSKIDRFSTSGNYDFNSESLSVISDKNRFEAIKEAARNAIESFISKMAIKGYRQTER